MSSSISSSAAAPPGLPPVFVCAAPLPTTFDERNGLLEVLDTPLTSSAFDDPALGAEAVAAAAPLDAACLSGEPAELEGCGLFLSYYSN